MTESDLRALGFVNTSHGWMKQPPQETNYQIHPDAVSDEAKLHDDILEYCRSKGWLFVHSRMDCRTTLARGVPDWIIFADKGRVFNIECKSRLGKLTTDQLAWIKMAQGLGHPVFVLRSMAEFLEATA